MYLQSFARLFFLLFFLSHSLTAQAESRLSNSPTDKVYNLSGGVRVAVVGSAKSHASSEQASQNLIIRILPNKETPNKAGEIQPEKAEASGDEFFAKYLLANLEKKGIDSFELRVEVPGTSVQLGGKGKKLFVHRELKYKRKEPGLWVPEGRPIPKKYQIENHKKKPIFLSNGAELNYEMLGVLSTNGGEPFFYASYSADWNSTGSREPLELVRLWARENLKKFRDKFDVVEVTLFRGRRKPGFHLRPKLKAKIVRKSANDFWLVSKVMLTSFESDGSKASMVWYIPEKPKAEMSEEEIFDNAKLLHKQYGEKIAEKAGVRLAFVMALWPSSNIGDQVLRFGTMFRKSSDGTWVLTRK